jgi:PBP1b-binding outer membrane lipoprotein LpoB
MRTRALVSAGMVGAALLVMGCSKSEPAETAPEQAAGQAPDTTTVGAEAARDSTRAAQGAYGDATAAGDTSAAAVQDTAAAGVPDTSGVAPDTTGLGAGLDSARSDSM